MKGLFLLGALTGGAMTAAAMAAAVEAKHPGMLAKDCRKMVCGIKKMMP